MDWTEETIVRLRGFWTDGHSTAEIGRRLGVTKNAVVGKAHRLALPARPSPIRRDGVPAIHPRRPTLCRVAGPTLPPLSSTSPPPGPASLVVASALTEPAGARSWVMPPEPEGIREQASPAEPTPVAPTPPESSPPHPIQPGPSPAAALRSPPAGGAPALTRAPPPRPYARSVTCCWPIGEPGTKSFRFCDDAAAGGKPYCAQHAAIAYVRVRDRREDAA